MSSSDTAVILDSTDGWTRLLLTDWVNLADGPAATVALTSRSWARPLDAEVVNDTASVRNVAIDVSFAARLANDLLEWCLLPLEDLAAADFCGEYELACAPGQTLTCHFGYTASPEDARIADHRGDRARLLITVGQERLTCQVTCSVDVTGCADFARELSGCLAELGST